MRPDYLKDGDTVAVVATAKKLEQGEIDGAIKCIESWGLKVVLGHHLFDSSNQFAGTDEHRTADLQWAIDSPEVKAVIFARGGYGTARIIDHIDWNKFIESPKWLCGFSDLTVIHSHVCRQHQIETLHTSMPIFFKNGVENGGSKSLRKALFGELEELSWKGHELNREGDASAQLIGGNLAVLDSIMGTPSALNWSGKILFIEDLTEYIYHLDRVMMQLKRSGQLSGLKGLVVGQFTDMMDNEIPFGKSAYEVILDAVKDYAYPIAFNAPIGHVDFNESIFHGRYARLLISESQSGLKFS